MSHKPCPTESELLSFVDAALSPEQLNRIEEHLAGCSACAEQVKALRALIAGIAAPVPSASHATLDVAAHVSSVMGRLDGPSLVSKRPRSALWGSAMIGVAAAAALVVLQLRPGTDVPQGEWTARGGPAVSSLSRDVGLQLYAQETSLRALEPGSRVKAGVAFTAGLRNLARTQAYVLLFAVDSKQVLHWITPQFTEPGSDPEATPIKTSTQERLLASSVVFDDLSPGPLRIVAMITAKPMHVSQIESLSVDELRSERWLQRFPQAEIRQLTLHVTP